MVPDTLGGGANFLSSSLLLATASVFSFNFFSALARSSATPFSIKSRSACIRTESVAALSLFSTSSCACSSLSLSTAFCASACARSCSVIVLRALLAFCLVFFSSNASCLASLACLISACSAAIFCFCTSSSAVLAASILDLSSLASTNSSILAFAAFS